MSATHWLLALAGWIRGAGATGVAVYAAVYLLATLLFLPGSILTAAAGFAYGPIWGTLLVSPVSVAAATLAFLLGRSLARRWVARRLERQPRFAAVDRAMGGRGFFLVLLLRLSPVLPFNLLNYGLGLTRVRLRDYVVASFLGMLPGTLLYVYLGSLVTSASELLGGVHPRSGPLGETLYWGGLAATLAVTVWVTRLANDALRRSLDGKPPARPTIADRPKIEAGRDADAQRLILPDDTHNRALVQAVHPASWQNPRPRGRYNLVVVGGGTAGLVSAAGAAGLGAKVALVERHLLGGDCLSFGCVPSKGLIRAARAVAAVREAGAFGLRVGAIAPDFGEAIARMRRLRAELAPHDSAQRMADLGVDVYLGEARFTARDAIEVDGQTLSFARAVIATGARARAPAVSGLADAGFLTNETVFSLTERPRRLVVLGGGPIGCELAQAFRRFGSEVTIIDRSPRLLPRDDEDAAAVLGTRFAEEGIALRLEAKLLRVDRGAGGKVVSIERGGRTEAVEGDEILVALGRAPNVEGLGLEAAGVAFGQAGVEVDERLRSRNPRIYAAGDVCSAYKFTHAADAMARIVLQNALFFGRKKASALVIPWCSYTDPEIAHVGLDGRQAKARGAATLTVPLADVDRAVLDGETAGFARVHADRRTGRVLGATIVASHAGEMIGEMALAVTAGLSLSEIAATIHPYPTQAEAWKKIGDAWARTKLTPRVHGVLERLLRWRR